MVRNMSESISAGRIATGRGYCAKKMMPPTPRLPWFRGRHERRKSSVHFASNSDRKSEQSAASDFATGAGATFG
jgi:hypothetical protein